MRFVALLVAAVIAVVAGIAALQMSGEKTPSQTPQTTASTQNPSVSTVEVMVARQPIEVGTILEQAMIDKQPWPSHLLLDGFITSDNADANLVGKVARASFQANEPITRSKIANPNDPSFLAAALPEGMRAVTLATDAISGVAGYVFPGDRVDVILTHNIPNDIQVRTDKSVRQSNKPDVAEILIANVRVLAVNVRQLSGKEAASSTPSSITLEVAEKDAQSVRLAEKVGTLSLALRPLKDGDHMNPDPTKSIALTNVKIYGTQSTSGVRIVRGANDKKIENTENKNTQTAPMSSASEEAGN